MSLVATPGRRATPGQLETSGNPLQNAERHASQTPTNSKDVGVAQRPAQSKQLVLVHAKRHPARQAKSCRSKSNSTLTEGLISDRRRVGTATRPHAPINGFS